MAKNVIQWEVPSNLHKISIPNASREQFIKQLSAIGHGFFSVEDLSDGDMIIIKKPGYKSAKDFVVYIYHPGEGLWPIMHDELFDDIRMKYNLDPDKTIEIIKALCDVCLGEEPDSVITKHNLVYSIQGLPIDHLLKVYKWIWGQEDCNYYPQAKGRWYSMDYLLESYNLLDYKRR